MSLAYLGLGSNVGDETKMLRRARIFINMYMGRVMAQSRLYRSAPWGDLLQKDFINQVVSIDTALGPKQLHHALLSIESLLDKSKDTKYGPRNIDIDLLLYEDKVINNNALQIPHPRMHERNFVLIPLAEIAPACVHPVLDKTISALAASCSDSSVVKPIKVSVTS